MNTSKNLCSSTQIYADTNKNDIRKNSKSSYFKIPISFLNLKCGKLQLKVSFCIFDYDRNPVTVYSTSTGNWTLFVVVPDSMSVL